MNVGGNRQTLVTITVDFNIVAQLTRSSLNLNSVMEEFFESSSVENTIVSRSGKVDYEFVLDTSLCFVASFSGGNDGLGLDNNNAVSLLRHLLSKAIPHHF